MEEAWEGMEKGREKKGGGMRGDGGGMESCGVKEGGEAELTHLSLSSPVSSSSPVSPRESVLVRLGKMKDTQRFPDLEALHTVKVQHHILAWI